MRDGWEAEARKWAQFARTPGHDRSHDSVNLPALRELLPEPGNRTLDLGCGEGTAACQDVAMIEIGPLRPGDRGAWEVLARGYKAFYRDPTPDEAYEATWQLLADGTELHGLGARLDGTLIGIAHYFFHPTFWSGEACYLQDLFVAEAVRGRGAARALIERVAEAARERGATRYYWHTQEDNTRARVLYDKVARYNGFIRYVYPL